MESCKSQLIPKPFGCDQCDKKFDRPSSLFRHEKVHMREKTDNGRLELKVKIMISPKSENTDSNLKPFKCSKCGKSFDKPTNLFRHEKIHERTFKCQQCEKELSTPSQLFKHEKLHAMKESNEKPFKCSHCERAFNRFDNMTAHEKIHTNINKKYKR